MTLLTSEETGDGNSEQKRPVEITVNICRSRLSRLNILVSFCYSNGFNSFSKYGVYNRFIQG